jgi:serine/threonine-protein kinase
MRVEPRFDVLRGDQRFVERLEKIKPLAGGKAPAESDDSTTETKTRNKFKARAAVTFAAILICLALFGAPNLRKLIWSDADSLNKILLLNKENSPDALPKEIAPQINHNEKPRTKDAVADGLYLAGKQQLETRTMEGINRSVGFFNDAVKRDPEFALAFSGLADAHIVLAGRQKETAKTAYRKAEEYAMKALALDPDLAEARVSLAMATFRNTGNFAAAERQFLRAIEINPSLSRAHHWYSVILTDTGQHEAALREIKIAAELEPHSAVIHHNVGVLNSILKRYDEAIAYFDKTIELDKGFANVYLSKAVAQELTGDWDGAVETYRIGRIYSGKDESEAIWILIQAQAHAAKGQSNESLALLNGLLQNPAQRKIIPNLSFDIALVYNLLGDAENACKWIEKIETKKLKDLNLIKQDPRFANLHNDERFLRLLEKPRKLN